MIRGLFQKPTAAWGNQNEMLVTLEINEPDGTRYRRPYVAVWVEDGEGYPVRTLSLWVQTRQPGPRWIPDLRRWYRSDRMRQFTDKTDLLATVSSPTRQPGKYSVVWNGKDDSNKPVAAGRYTVCVEAAREHGTYQLMRKAVTVGAQPFKADLGSNVEVKSATVEYRRRRA